MNFLLLKLLFLSCFISTHIFSQEKKDSDAIGRNIAIYVEDICSRIIDDIHSKRVYFWRCGGTRSQETCEKLAQKNIDLFPSNLNEITRRNLTEKPTDDDQKKEYVA